MPSFARRRGGKSVGQLQQNCRRRHPATDRRRSRRDGVKFDEDSKTCSTIAWLLRPLIWAMKPARRVVLVRAVI